MISTQVKFTLDPLFNYKHVCRRVQDYSLLKSSITRTFCKVETSLKNKSLSEIKTSSRTSSPAVRLDSSLFDDVCTEGVKKVAQLDSRAQSTMLYQQWDVHQLQGFYLICMQMEKSKCAQVALRHCTAGWLICLHSCVYLQDKVRTCINAFRRSVPKQSFHSQVQKDHKLLWMS